MAYGARHSTSGGFEGRGDGFGSSGARDRRRDRDRNRQSMASALSGGVATLAGAHPLTSLVASGLGGYAAGRPASESISRTLGTGLGMAFGGPIGGMIGNQLGGWLSSGSGGRGGSGPSAPRPSGPRQTPLGRRDRYKGNNAPPLIWPPVQGGPGRQGMIGALI